MSISIKKAILGALAIALSLGTSLGTAGVAKADWSSQRLVKVSTSPAVYLVEGGMRYTFVHAEAYFTWFKDFSGVQTISQAEMNALSLGGNVFVRPGTKFVQFTETNKKGYDSSYPLYVVDMNGKLVKVEGASGLNALAQAYGSNWANNVIQLNNAFYQGYSIGGSYTSAMYPNGQLIQYAGDSQIYVVKNGKKAPVTSDGFVANKFNTSFVVTAPASLTYANDAAVTSVDSSFAISGNQGAASGNTGTVATGSLMASLSSDTPASNFVPMSSTNVKFLNVKLTAGAEAAKVDSIKIHRYGAGSSSNFNNVYVYEGNSRLTLGRTLNSSSNEATFTGLNLSVAAGQTRTISIAADIASNASGAVSGFEIVSAGDISGPATISGTFPIRGNLMSFSSASAGFLTVDKTGSPSNPKVGDTSVVLGQFKLQASSAEDLTISRVSLYQAGSIDKAQLMNLSLYQAGNKVAMASGINAGNLAVFEFTSPFSMLKGDSKTFEIRGDIGLQARVATTIQFYLDQASDLYAVGNTYGFGVGICNQIAGTTNPCGATITHSTTPLDSTNASTLTISGAQFSIQFTGPASTDVARNTQEVSLYTGKFMAQANLEVRKVNVTLTSTGGNLGSGTTAYYTNVKLVNADTGATLFGPTDGVTTAGTSGSIDLQGPYSFEAGKLVNFKIIANLSNSITADSTIKVTLNQLNTSDVRNLDTGLTVSSSDIVPFTALAGNTHTVRAGSLTVSLANSPSSQSYTRGTLSKDLVGVILKASSAQAITLKGLTVQTYIGSPYANLCAAASSANFVTSSVLTATGGSTTTVAQSTLTASTNYAGMRVLMITGLNAGLERTVSSNTATTFTTAAFPNANANTDTYIVYGVSCNTLTAVLSAAPLVSLLTTTSVAPKDRISTVQLVDSSTGQAVGDAKSIGSDGKASFTNLNYALPAGSSKTLYVRTDVSNNALLGGDAAGSFISYRIAADVVGSGTDYSSVITANDSQGNSATITGPSGSINATVAPTSALSVIGSGSLSVSAVSDSDVDSRLVVGGANGVSMGRFKFAAVNEDVTISKLQVQVLNNAGPDVAFAGNVQGIYIVDGSDVYGQGGKGATSPVSIDTDGIAKFDGLAITIPKDGTKSITVKVDTKTISGGATTGSEFAVALTADSSGDSDIEAVGVGSGTRINGTGISGLNTTADSSVKGNPSVIYRSIPTVATVSSGLSTAAELGSGVKIYKFSVSADKANDLGLKKVAFSVSGSNTGATPGTSDLTIGTYYLYDVSGSSDAAVAGTFSDGTNAASSAAELLAGTTMTFVSTNEINITAGTTKTFELRADITAAGGVAGYNLNTKLAGSSDTYAASAAYNTSLGNFVWSDQSAASHTTSTADWNNGYKVPGLAGISSVSKLSNF